MVKTHVEESLGANPGDAALNPADSVAMGVQSATVPRVRTGGAFRALSHAQYRLLFVSFLVNQLGFWLSHIAMQGLMVDLTENDPFFIGLLFFALLLPAFLFAPLAGVAADRFDRQRIMLSCYATVGLVAGALTAITAAGLMTATVLLSLSVLMGTAFAFSGPPTAALAANAVPAIDLPSAVALQSAANNLTRVFGPTLAAPLVATGRFDVAFGVFMVCSALTALLVARMRPAPFVPDLEEAGILGRLRQGLDHAHERRPAMPALVTVATLSVFGVSHVTLLPVFAEEVLGTSEMFVWLVATTGFGAMMGALVTGFERRDPSLRGGALRMIGYGFSLLTFAYTTTPLGALVTQFAVGYFYFAVMTGLQTLIQQIVAESRRGRVMSLFQVCWAGLVPFGGLGMGAVGGAVGFVPTLAGAGAICLLYAVVTALIAPRLGDIDVRRTER